VPQTNSTNWPTDSTASAAKIRSALDGVAGSLRGSVFRIDHYIRELEERGGSPEQVEEFRQGLEVMAATSATLVRIIGTNRSVTLDKASKENNRSIMEK
jgi:hypothetical protein